MASNEDYCKYRELIHRRVSSILPARYRADWDDVTQESLIKLLRSLESQETGGDAIHSPEAYAQEIAKNCCFDFLRKVRSKSFTAPSEITEVVFVEKGLEQVDHDDEIRAIDDLISKNFRGVDFVVAVNLRREDPAKAIQAVTGISRSAAYRRMAAVTEKIIQLGREHEMLAKVYTK